MYPAHTPPIPWIFWGTEVLKGLSPPYVAMVIIKFRANRLIVAKFFSSPLFTSLNPAKCNACNAACDYIGTHLMSEPQQQDNVTIQQDDGSKDDQSEDDDSNVEDDISAPDGINIISEEESVAINDGSSNIDEEELESHQSESDKEDTSLPIASKTKKQRKTTQNNRWVVP